MPVAKPLVSIIIPAYNAEAYLPYTLESAIIQSWKRKEIIVVNDGSTDRTLEVAKRLATKEVRVVSTANQGLSAAVNHGLSLCQGDYVQELDADDILAPDKIEKQLAALRESDSKRTLLSSPWAHFYYRTRIARFIPNSLWQDLSPVEWLLRKMGEDLHMQNATWLVSRELIEAAGPWDANLRYDQDGEYFCRVLLASEGTRFVRDARIFYRVSGSHSISHIGGADRDKRLSFMVSIKLHLKYLQSLEDSERVRKTCLIFLQNKLRYFYNREPEIAAELEAMAAQLGGQLELPYLRRKYAWLRPVIGHKKARLAQEYLPQLKATVLRRWDAAMFSVEKSLARHPYRT
jgi:glycosyltransferase involved in cell wall biosynthesis